jgi:iron-sulfur cluster repair protein YtfE (RIC family)
MLLAAGESMDALEILKQDHDKVKSLFADCHSAADSFQMWQTYQIIRNELQLHTYVEETIFYPTFFRYDEFKDIVERSREEHDQVKDLLDEIDDIGDTRPGEFKAKLEELEKGVEDHIRMEEEEFFPMARKAMKRSEREQLGRHIQAAKQEPIAA